METALSVENNVSQVPLAWENVARNDDSIKHGFCASELGFAGMNDTLNSGHVQERCQYFNWQASGNTDYRLSD